MIIKFVCSSTGTAAALAVLLLAGVATPARADRRNYTFTYDAVTTPARGFDVELWSTFRPRKDASPRSFYHQLELEYGITPRWDVHLYNNFRQVEGQGFEYDSLFLASRLRLAEPGSWFVDPVLYIEGKKQFVDDKAWALEEKLLLGRDFDRINLTVNLVAEQSFGGDEVELEFEPTIGVSYELHPTFHLGVEAFSELELEEEMPGGEKELEAKVWAGPALSYATGTSPGSILNGWWVTVTGAAGLTEGAEAFVLRAILAFQF